MITMDKTLFIQIINIIILMFLLNKVMYKPVLGILRERSKKMKGTQDEIERFEKTGEDTLREPTFRLRARRKLLWTQRELRLLLQEMRNFPP